MSIWKEGTYIKRTGPTTNRVTENDVYQIDHRGGFTDRTGRHYSPATGRYYWVALASPKDNPCTEVSLGQSQPCVLEVPEASDETLTETKETTMKEATQIVDTVILNGLDLRKLSVTNLIGFLKSDRQALKDLREDLGDTKSLLKNIDKLTAPYINSIARLTQLIDDKAGEIDE